MLLWDLCWISLKHRVPGLWGPLNLAFFETSRQPALAVAKESWAAALGSSAWTGIPGSHGDARALLGLLGTTWASERERKELPRGKAWSEVLCRQGAWAEPQTQIFGAGFVPEPESCWLRLL